MLKKFAQRRNKSNLAPIPKAEAILNKSISEDRTKALIKGPKVLANISLQPLWSSIIRLQLQFQSKQPHFRRLCFSSLPRLRRQFQNFCGQHYSAKKAHFERIFPRKSWIIWQGRKASRSEEADEPVTHPSITSCFSWPAFNKNFMIARPERPERGL